MQSERAGHDVPTQQPSFARLRGSRIIELHARRLAGLEDIERLNREVIAALLQAGPGAVICGDYRFASPVSREVARVWAQGMRGANRRIVRSGLLIDPANTMFNLQVRRVVKCAVNPSRRLFEDLGELCDWIGAGLRESERDAIREIFSGEPA
jgi:hypothetical protein